MYVVRKCRSKPKFHFVKQKYGINHHTRKKSCKRLSTVKLN